MGVLGRRLLYSLVIATPVLAVVVLLVLGVTYKPYGVPDHRRGEYEQALTSIADRQRLVDEVEASGGVPVAEVVSRSYDFGRVNPHETMVHDFSVKNEGEAPLTIRIGQTSCKCTVGKMRGNGVLLPGESTNVSLTWNTGLKADSYSQSAQLFTNDPLQKRITLTVKGEVRAELVGPETLNYGGVDLGDVASASVVYFSQLWNEFEVVGVNGCGEALQWHAEPISTDEAVLAGREATSAVRLYLDYTVLTSGMGEAELEVLLKPCDGGDVKKRTLSCSWKTRSPIAFVHPELHKDTGLELGTLASGIRHEFPLIVRQRLEHSRELAVLDYHPKELDVSIEPAGIEGVYRLLIAVPKDCGYLQFNLDQNRGYVKVGDPNDKSFQNWLPIDGAVARLNNG